MFTDERNQQIVSEISKYFDDHLDTSSIIGAAANHAGPRHLRKLARQAGTTEREMWKEIGFTLEKPYETAESFQRALSSYQARLSQQARRGLGDIRQKTGFGGAKVFKDLITGEEVQVKFSPEGVPLNLPGGQKAYDVFPLKADDEFSEEVVLAYLTGVRMSLSSSPEAAARFEEIIEAASNTDRASLLRWADKDGTPQFYLPVLQNKIEAGWKRRVSAISKKISQQPVREVEAAQEALRVHFEKNYADLVDDAMPVVNAEGKFIYELIDEQGNRVGKPVALQAKQALLADENLDEFFARRIQMTEGAVSARARTTSRFQGLGYMAARSADIRRVGLFTNSPFIDFQDGMVHAIRRTEVLKAMRALTIDALATAVKQDTFGAIQRVPVEGGAIGTGNTLKKLLTSERGIDSAKFKDIVRMEATREGLWKRNDKAGVQMFNEMLDDMSLDEGTWRELNDWLSYHESPQTESMFGRAVDASMSIFKSGLLSTPRTVARDALSATTMAFVMQDLSLTPAGFRSLADGAALARGKAARDGLNLPEIRELAQSLGLDPKSADDRQRAFTSAYAAMANQVAGVHAQLNTDELTKIASGQADAYLKARPMSMMDSLQRVFGENIARDPVTGQVQTLNTLNNFFNPMKMMQVPGAMKWDTSSKSWVVNSKSNWVADLHGTVRGTLDNAVRMGSVLHRMRTRGESMRTAFETVATHQVNYDPRRFTKFERKWMKRLYPFYSFISRMVPLVATELVTNPGGPLSQVIRAQRVMQGDQDAYIPYDLQDTAAIPWGQNEEGDLRYVTNLGLMHEDALRYIAPVDGVRGLLQKVLGSMNPAAKFAVEYGTNTSTFFDGPMGGRRLDDLDPLLGRILVNMGIRDLPPSGRPEPFGNAFTEALVANSPISAALQYVRTVSESSDRRSASEKVFNLVTGVRTRLLTPEMLTRELRDRLNAEQIALGARPLTTVLGTSGLADRYEEAGGVEEADRLRTIEAALRDIRKQAQKRRKEKEG